MVRNYKEILLKDLCARLPYGVKVEYENKTFDIDYISSYQEIKLDEFTINYTIDISEVKPYLFPLSSMTEEQYKKFTIISGWDVDIEDVRRGKFSCIGYIGLDYLYDAIDWFNKNHFDYRGLIPLGLAIDATGLNIYER